MCESQADDRACTGSFEMSACHQLSAGNSEQRVPEIGFARSGRYGGGRRGTRGTRKQQAHAGQNADGGTGDGTGVGGNGHPPTLGRGVRQAWLYGTTSWPS